MGSSGDVLGCFSALASFQFAGRDQDEEYQTLTPFAAQVAAEDAAKKALEQGLRSVDLFLKGPGAGREPGSVRARVAGRGHV